MIDPRAYADGVLDLLERRALHADRVDWAAERSAISPAAARAAAPADLHEALRAVVRRAGGPHSGLVPRRPTRPRLARPASLPDVRLGTGVAVLTLPACPGDPRSAWRYVVAGGRALREAAPARGWVVDLRSNTGGSMWPMLAVAAPLLGGDGPIGAFVDRTGSWTPWWLRGRRVGCGRGTRAWSLGPRRRNGALAVLTDARTASSGEAVAVAFRGRPGALVYGAATCGWSTGNETFRLGDGALLHLTTSRFADRAGTVLGGPLPVDVPCDDPLAAAVGALSGARG